MNKLMIITLCFLSQLQAFDMLSQLSNEVEKINRNPEFWEQSYNSRASIWLKGYAEHYQRLSDVKLFLLKIKAAIHARLGPKFDYFVELTKQGQSLPGFDDLEEYIYVQVYYAARKGGELDERVREIEILQSLFTPSSLKVFLNQKSKGNVDLLMLNHIANAKELLEYSENLHQTMENLENWSEFNIGIKTTLNSLTPVQRAVYQITVKGLLRSYLELSSIYGMSRLLNYSEQK